MYNCPARRHGGQGDGESERTSPPRQRPRDPGCQNGCGGPGAEVKHLLLPSDSAVTVAASVCAPWLSPPTSIFPMPTPYAPLPNPRYAAEDAQRELDDAFDSDDEGQDSSESTPLTRALPPRSDSHYHPPLDTEFPEPIPTPQSVPGGYDFERDYDYPPPGSPPGPSSLALPNDFGNSNGLLPTAPVRPPQPRVSFWRRAAGALLPQHYVRVPMEAPGPRVVGGGTENDGVFANVAAKPSRGIEITDANGDVHLVPEEVQKETPPVRCPPPHPASLPTLARTGFPQEWRCIY